jgi:hypothetical protein
MNSMPEDLPDDPVLLKQMLGQMLDERQLDKGKIVRLEEQNALLLQRLFGRKSEQTADAATPQLALFNEVESVVEPVDEASDEEVVAPTKRRGKRKPLPADLPRIEIIHELPEHELTCICGCRKHTIGEEVSEQLEIVPMQIRVIRHVRKVYGCRDCEMAPVTADKPAQLIEKKKHGQPKCSGDAADHQVRRWTTASPFRKSLGPPWRRYPAPDVGTLGYPVR